MATKTSPSKKDQVICSPRHSQPSREPTTGWNKKYRPEVAALSIWTPRFHSTKVRAVEIKPRYKKEPPIDRLMSR